MEDESIGANKTTDFFVKITNNSATPVPNYRVFVNRLAGAVTVSPPNILIPRLDPGEMEECHFLVSNTTGAVQTNYTLRVRSTYFGGVITHTYDNFREP
jgi:hypothetical protein